MWSVRNKLLGAFAVILLFTGVIGWNGISNIRQIQSYSSEVTNKWMVGIESINTIVQFVEQYMANNYQLQLTDKADEKKQLVASRDTLIMNIEQSMNTYAATLTDEEDRRSNYDSLANNWSMFKKAYEKIAATAPGSPEEEQATQGAVQFFNNMRSMLKLMVMYDHNGAVQSTKDAESLYRSSLRTFSIIGGLALLVNALFAYLLIRNITKPLKASTQALHRIANGELTQQPIKTKRKDEFGKMIQAVNSTLEQLQASVKKMQVSSLSVAHSSKQLNERAESNASSARSVTEAIEQVASGSEHQVQFASECNTVIEEMASGVQRIAENTAEVADLSKESAGSAKDGSEKIQRVSRKMDELCKSLEQTEETIRKLEAHTVKIGSISTLIGDIATRTNLLSLNAAIEAAHAGQHGKGFAVVAEEVRKLAAQTDESSKDIIELIEAIQADTDTAVRTMSESLAEIRDSSESVKVAERSFEAIVGSTELVTMRIQETAAAAQQLSASSEEVAASIDSMSHLAVQTASMAQQVGAATEEQLAASEDLRVSSGELSAVAGDLEELVTRFKL
ncbi:methyl-accepting chemotaxis protein [Cohnella thailandensis]|uniref:MCP four helix bundle domain-containing protein n=1 Tax=Cohnella thailandensis TaxID=557557 RepID=A0A841T053_9BACL|nr:methyl-accepting chemotaxis protein [Cohnella thailandensis]MBB6635257.1 MCP four helix bundle domain-containing protein [Cohnella thailandensis]MBP1974629.1 methyl-accepting chemotaxis protein [Cohnella thailandensis]